MDQFIFENEVDIAMECLLSEKDNREIESIVESANENILISENNYSIIDTVSIPLDESDIDPIGMVAEEIIATEQEILLGHNETEIIDMMMF